jgi:hypothetical protein
MIPAGERTDHDVGSGLVQKTTTVRLALYVRGTDASTVSDDLAELEGVVLKHIGDAVRADPTLGKTCGSLLHVETLDQVSSDEPTIPLIRQDLVFEAQRFEDIHDPYLPAQGEQL